LALTVISGEGVSGYRKAGVVTVYPPSARSARPFFALWIRAGSCWAPL
jgi:hypothetical protein